MSRLVAVFVIAGLAVIAAVVVLLLKDKNKDSSSAAAQTGSSNVTTSSVASSSSSGSTPTPPSSGPPAPRVDCELSGWTNWSSCSETCGGGTQTRRMNIITPASGGGSECPSAEDLIETRACNTEPCECEYGPWSDYGPCVSGLKTRTREPLPGQPDECRAEVDSWGCVLPQCILTPWTSWQPEPCDWGTTQQRWRDIQHKQGDIVCPAPGTTMRETRPCPTTSDCQTWVCLETRERPVNASCFVGSTRTVSIPNTFCWHDCTACSGVAVCHRPQCREFPDSEESLLAARRQLIDITTTQSSDSDRALYTSVNWIAHPTLVNVIQRLLEINPYAIFYNRNGGQRNLMSLLSEVFAANGLINYRVQYCNLASAPRASFPHVDCQQFD